MMKTLRIVIAAILLGTACIPSFALGGFSRACNFNDIPATLQNPALALFYTFLGMPYPLTNLASRPDTERKQHWILESITVDYGSLRYYLFAENKVYRMKGAQSSAEFFLETGYKSPWAAQSLDPRAFTDDRLKIFRFNRYSFSARAGHPDIVQFYSKNLNWRYQDWFQVVGQHYYYDPVSKATGYLGRSRSYDCALTEWGLEDRGGG